jgi:eukaryotic-like serine/threonine-protein kinase
MKPDEDKQALLCEALQKLKGVEREAFLDGACVGNPQRRALLEALLQAEDSPVLSLESRGPSEDLTVLVPPPEGPGSMIGRYKLLEKIGEGGFGAVYVAEQRSPVRRRVALKLIKPGMDTRQVVGRFEAERQALALMDHPNIARVLDAGATGTGRPFFVMELVKGVPITQFCEQENLDIGQRLDLFVKVCHAVQHAHQKGIIHRDIKPSNILVTLHDGVPSPMVIDFGIAKATQQELTDMTVYTQLQQFIGTPAYMSPEQAEMSGLDVDTRSDVYSLGVLLYELLAGSTPFDTKELLASGLDEMRRIIREREPVRPSTRLRQKIAPAISRSATARHSPLARDLDWIVMKCLEKDRRRRYQTANGVAEDIERHLKHEPVVARRPTVRYRLQKSIRRNRLVFTSAGVVVLALMLGAGASLWQAIRATKAELSARENLYNADMILAGQATELNNVGRALDLLNRHRPAHRSQRDLRGWEWRYLWELCRSDEVARFGEHDGIVQSAAVSPDGQWAASGGFDGLIKVWEMPQAASSSRLLTNLHLGGSPVSSVSFSPDGRWLAGLTWTNGFALFSVPWWERAMTVKNTEAIGWGGSVAFSSDSRFVAMGGEVWDLEARVRLCALPFQSALGQPKVAWVPNTQTLAGLGVSDGVEEVWLFDVRSTNPARVAAIPVKARGDWGGELRSLAFSPDGRHLAAGCGDGAIHIHFGDDWRKLAILTNHPTWVSSVAFSGDGKWLVSGSGDHSARVWRTSDWQETAQLRGHEEEVWTVAFAPDSQQLVSGSKDNSVRLWPLASRSKPHKQVSLSGKGDQIAGLSGMRPFSFGPSNVLTIWDGHTLQIRQRLSEYPISNVVNCRPSPDGGLLLVTTAEGGLWLMDLAPVAASPPVCLQTEGLQVKETAFSDHAKWLAVSDGEWLRVWDMRGQSPRPMAALAKGNFSTLRFSRDERLVGAVTGPILTERIVRVWEVDTGKELARFQPHRDEIYDFDFSPDNTMLATAGGDNTSKLFDLRAGEVVMTLRGQLLALFSVSFSPDGRRLATGTGGDEILIWDLKTGRDVLAVKGRGSDVTMVRFLTDGNSLLWGDGKSLHLWRAPSWGEIESVEQKQRASGHGH